MKKSLLILSIFLLKIFGVNAQLAVFTDDYNTGISASQFGATYASFWSTSIAESYSGTSSLKISVGANGDLYTGGTLSASSNQNLTAYNALTFWIKASRNATLNSVGFGNSASGSIFNTAMANLALTPTWIKVIIPIPSPSKLTSEKGMFWISEASNDAGLGAYNIFVDDIQFELVTPGVIGIPAVSFASSALLGFVSETLIPNATVSYVYPVNGVNQSLTSNMSYLTLNNTDASIATLNPSTSIITAIGVGTTSITGTLEGSQVTGSVSINVFSEPVAPSTPTVPAVNVKSLYSNAYTNSSVNTWTVNTYRATVSDVVVGDNNLKKYYFVVPAPYALTNYCQVQFLATNAIDATAYNYLHIDVFTPGSPASSISTVFQLKMIDYGADNLSGGTGVNADKEHALNLVSIAPLIPNSWVSYDLPLSSFTTLTSRSHINQILLTGTSGSTVYVDNIVFSTTGTLPVSLSSFKVQKKNNASLLTWTTSCENNNKGFAIEYSADNMVWQEIAFVKGVKNSNESTNYSYPDNGHCTGINYYRLKQIDFDGQFKNSSIVMLNYSEKALKKISFYPNPARDHIAIHLGNITGVKATIDLISLDGKIVRTKILNNSMSYTLIDFTVSDMNKGLYFLRLRDSGAEQTEKLVIN